MVVRFGPFRLDVAQRRLLEGGREIRLAPKAFDLLRVLIDQRPRALAKDDLMSAVWPDVFVTDNNVATVVRDVRAALGDDAAEPRYIRTVFGFGYAFVGDAVAEDEEAAPAGRLRSGWHLVLDGREVQLFEGENVVGRAGHGVIVIEAPTISRRHARLLVNGATVHCEDLGSKNGTWVETSRVGGPTAVGDGHHIRFGSVVGVLRRPRQVTSTDTIDLA